MKYQVKRLTPEFKAISYIGLVVLLCLLYSLYAGYVSKEGFLAGYFALSVVTGVASWQQSEMVDERRVDL